MGDVRPQMASLHLRIGFRHSHMELFRMIIVVKGKTKDKEKFEKKLCLFCPSPPNFICSLYLQKFEQENYTSIEKSSSTFWRRRFIVMRLSIYGEEKTSPI